jgi:hypothetical protein
MAQPGGQGNGLYSLAPIPLPNPTRSNFMIATIASPIRLP